MKSQEILANTIRLGPVHLRVVDIPASLPVWRDVVGLSTLTRDGGIAELGVNGKILIVLHAGATTVLPSKSRDLFHVAIHVTTRKELARVAARVRASSLRHSAQDHLISETLYVSDPSGNGIEICFDTPGRFASREEMAGGGVSLVAKDGTRHSGLEPLDIDRLLQELDPADRVKVPLAADTFIGHIHMRARSPETLMAFYLGVLGFRPHIQSATFGLFDCGTEERAHMVAFSIWARDELKEPPVGAAGLEHFTVVLPTREDLAAVARRLGDAHVPWLQTGGALDLSDPEGNRLRMVLASD
ncbi:catechol 1,2-dioxygenase [Mesorhizobium kowhaii]|uniref:Catechol 1,2-dioxygenase n=2 Tax=Mesorhizobium kowhaii TaxID=1300272 RepID=A0A2W7BR06_9HYPH|nr:catechol 1,2-dioxygenase [Mesorhizobium kowhaii]